MAPPPGSLGLPFVGEAFAFLRDPFGFQLERTRKHGPVWKTRILGSTVVFFAGPAAFTFFLDPDNFTRERGSPPHMQELLHPDAVPFIDGDRHQTRKRLLLAAFTPEAMTGYLPGLERLIGRYVERWTSNGEVTLAPELTRLAFDVANVLFAAADPERSDATRAADFDTMIRGMFATPIRLPFTTYGRSLRARDRLRAYIADAVADRTGEGTALGVLKSARGAKGEVLSTRELEIELLHFFGAAHAALASALAWLVVALGRHDEVRAKVAAEVRAAPDGPLDLDAITGLHYTAAVGREVRRAWPIAPTTFFGVALKDLELDGLTIKKGWKGTGAIWPTLQDGKTFDDPDRFAPERLADDKLAALPANSFVPQGGGPFEGHRCAGEALVDLILPLFTAQLLRGHELSVPEQDLGPGPGGLGPLPRSGLRVRISAG